MHDDIPRPPTRRHLLAAGLSGGITIGVWGITLVAHLVFKGIPPTRLVGYATIGLIGIGITTWLAATYAIRRHRRAAWWEGFVAQEDPTHEAEVIDLAAVRGHNGTAQRFVANSPS